MLSYYNFIIDHYIILPYYEKWINITLKHEALYNSCTTWPIAVLEACGYCASSRCTTNRTSTFRDRADPSSNASKISFNTSSCIAGIWIKHQYMVLKLGLISVLKIVFKYLEYMVIYFSKWCILTSNNYKFEILCYWMNTQSGFHHCSNSCIW